MKNIFISINSTSFYLVLLAFIGVSFIFAHYSYQQRRYFEIEIVFKTSTPVDFGIYYDIGEGLSQEHHQIKRVEEVDQITSVSFCIASHGQLRALRIDPAMETIQMEIYAITITFSDRPKMNVSLEKLQPGEQIRRHSWDGEKLTFQSVAKADDPNFILTGITSNNNRMIFYKKIYHYGLWILGGFIFALLWHFFILYFVRGK